MDLITQVYRQLRTFRAIRMETIACIAYINEQSVRQAIFLYSHILGNTGIGNDNGYRGIPYRLQRMPVPEGCCQKYKEQESKYITPMRFFHQGDTPFLQSLQYVLAHTEPNNV